MAFFFAMDLSIISWSLSGIKVKTKRPVIILSMSKFFQTSFLKHYHFTALVLQINVAVLSLHLKNLMHFLGFEYGACVFEHVPPLQGPQQEGYMLEPITCTPLHMYPLHSFDKILCCKIFVSKIWILSTI